MKELQQLLLILHSYLWLWGPLLGIGIVWFCHESLTGDENGLEALVSLGRDADNVQEAGL